INSELRAMMNQVIHDKAAHHRCARQRKDRLARHEQRPLPSPILVCRSFKSSAGCSDILIESLQQCGARFRFFQAVGFAVRRDIQFVAIEGLGRPTRNICQVCGQAAESHRLLVRLPIKLVFRNSLQGLSCAGHCVIEFRQNGLTDRHKDLLRSMSPVLVNLSGKFLSTDFSRDFPNYLWNALTRQALSSLANLNQLIMKSSGQLMPSKIVSAGDYKYACQSSANNFRSAPPAGSG